MPLEGRIGETKGEPMVRFGLSGIGLSGTKLTCLREGLFDWRLGLPRLREGLFDEVLFPFPLESTVSS